MNPKELLNFPRLLASILWSLIFYTLTEVETFLAAVVAVLFGLHFGWLWGLTIFFSLYFAMRMTGGYVSLIASKLHLLARVMAEKEASDND